MSRGGWRALPLAWPPVQLPSLLTTRAFLSPSCLLLSCSFLLPFLPPTRLPHPAPAPQIKRFLEDADDAELNKFVKDFPGSETYHPPEAKTLVPRPQIQEPRPQASDLCQDDLEFKPPSWPQPSDSQQYFSASAPLSPSARPRSPWGKLDPYDSSEVEPPAPSVLMQEALGREPREPQKCVLRVCEFVCAPTRGWRRALSCVGPSSVGSPPHPPCIGTRQCQQGEEPRWWPDLGPQRSVAVILEGWAKTQEAGRRLVLSPGVLRLPP